jgi:hypothetical protein
MSPDDRDADLQLAIDGELRLLQAQTRHAADLVDALLDPEFFEFGASGRRWSRRAIIEMLAAEAGPAAEVVAAAGTAEVAEAIGPEDAGDPGDVAIARDVQAARIAPGVVLVTYVSEDSERRCHRSSIWRLTARGWQLFFHQGTPIPLATESSQSVTRPGMF